MTRYFLHISLMSALLICAIPAVGVAQTDSDSTKEARYEELHDKAKKLYGEKKFEESLKMFEAAYNVKNNPKLLFNMGIICERLGKLEQAVGYYDKFVVSPDLTLSLRAKGQKRLDILRPIVKAQKQKEEDARKAEEAKNTKKNDKKKKTPVKPKPESNNKAFGYVLTGVGAAGMLGGGVLLLTLGDEMAFTEETTSDNRRSARTSRNNRKVTGTILLGAGAAILGTGLLVWALSGDEPETETTDTAWTISPAIGIGNANISIFKRF